MCAQATHGVARAPRSHIVRPRARRVRQQTKPSVRLPIPCSPRPIRVGEPTVFARHRRGSRSTTEIFLYPRARREPALTCIRHGFMDCPSHFSSTPLRFELTRSPSKISRTRLTTDRFIKKYHCKLIFLIPHLNRLCYSYLCSLRSRVVSERQEAPKSPWRRHVLQPRLASSERGRCAGLLPVSPHRTTCRDLRVRARWCERSAVGWVRCDEVRSMP